MQVPHMVYMTHHESASTKVSKAQVYLGGLLLAFLLLWVIIIVNGDRIRRIFSIIKQYLYTPYILEVVEYNNELDIAHYDYQIFCFRTEMQLWNAYEQHFKNSKRSYIDFAGDEVRIYRRYSLYKRNLFIKDRQIHFSYSS